jgi:uncharacterized membrane protein
MQLQTNDTTTLYYIICALCVVIALLLIFISIRMYYCHRDKIRINKFMEGIRKADPNLYAKAYDVSNITALALIFAS